MKPQVQSQSRHPASVVPDKEFITHITYNTEGQPTEVTESGFSPIDAKGRPQPTALTRTTTYTYQTIKGHSLLTQIDGPLPDGPTQSPVDSDITQFEWDRGGSHVVKLTSPLQLVARYTYDAAGRISAVTDPDGITMHIDDNYFGRPEKVLRQVAGGGQGWSFQYDAQNRLIQVSRVDGSQERPQDRMAYDSAGRLLWQATALGTLKQASYDTEGHVLSGSVRTAGHEQSERYGYDDRGRLIFVSDGTGSTYRLQYTKNGQLQSVINPLGQITRLAFDVALHPVSVTTAADTRLARTVSVSRNHAEQSLTVMPALKDQQAPTVTTRTLKDDFGRIVAITSPNSGETTYRYDDDNRLIRKTNALGQARHYQYDVAGRLIRQYTTQGTGHAVPESTTTYRYTGTRLVETIDPAQTTRYGYNQWGQLTAKTVVLHSHQGTEITATTNYAYDRQGRLATKTLPDGSLLRYLRDGQGQIVSMQWRDGLSGPTRTLVSHLKRDLGGLAALTYGNGIQAKWQRSKAGVLARIVYSLPDEPGQTSQTASSDSRRVAWDHWLGWLVSPVKADEPPASSQTNSAWPGAYGIPVEPNTLWDARYLYDDLGNILAVQHQGRLVGDVTQSRYHYDMHNELIEAQYGHGSVLVRSGGSSHRKKWVAQAPKDARSWRYLLDGNANRLYVQQDSTASQPATTQTIRYQPNSQRLAGAGYDANGQIQAIDSLQIRWNAEGRLQSLWNGAHEIARYRYNATGERVAKIVDSRSGHSKETLYLYDQQRHRQAKLDAAGHILRQYFWLGDKLVAVVDYPEGRKPLGNQEPDTFNKLNQYIGYLWGGSLVHTGSGRISYLLDNHLGAPIAATDAQAQVIWRAHYGPYGQQLDVADSLVKDHFSLSLRNPGQWQDKESGLYYNDHRYYDPATGRYLSPDPLGLAGGLNAYAYVAANPIAYTDPYGLMLFAFDGTNNGAPGHLVPGNDTSNVYRFYDAYQFSSADPRYYITGIGTTYPEKHQNYRGNPRSGDGFTERLSYATADLNTFIARHNPTDTLNIDVVGFSRGAAEARAWVNQIVAQTNNGLYSFTQEGENYSACLNFRFEGLFETVPHLGWTGGDNASLNLSIPDQVQYAVQALALNENRGGPTNFNAYSIMPTPTTPNSTTPGATRIEQGFIGSHSDIGGGYGIPGTTNDKPEGDLSNVAYTWMYNQAKAAGVTELKPNTHTQVNSPILHDEVTAHIYYFGGRTIQFGDGSVVPETSARINSTGNPDKVTQDWTSSYITLNHRYRTVHPPHGGAPYTQTLPPCPEDASIIGMVDMTTYGAWLKSIGVDITSSNPSPTQQMCQ
ncbi:RHS repeat-associated core domain-containing protein [Halothiobacillus neapolitanus]|uniref:RHS repeat-associated core domain-containing protein n=1 Tax=Halothiobacillus neapolitanus TaxID=927 RepID=UPI00141513A2|nr:RHS repeat-associated core domain-containing protein [Halothiobacillus neapolitanus]